MSEAKRYTIELLPEAAESIDNLRRLLRCDTIEGTIAHALQLYGVRVAVIPGGEVLAIKKRHRLAVQWYEPERCYNVHCTQCGLCHNVPLGHVAWAWPASHHDEACRLFEVTNGQECKG